MRFQKILNISSSFNKQRQRGRAVKAPDLKSGGAGLPSTSWDFRSCYVQSEIFIFVI